MKIETNDKEEIKRAIKYLLQEYPECNKIYMDTKTYKINNFKPFGIELHHIDSPERFIIVGA